MFYIKTNHCTLKNNKYNIYKNIMKVSIELKKMITGFLPNVKIFDRNQLVVSRFDFCGRSSSQINTTKN